MDVPETVPETGNCPRKPGNRKLSRKPETDVSASRFRSSENLARNKEPIQRMADRMKFTVTPAQIGVARARLAEAGFSPVEDIGVRQKDGYRVGDAVEHGRLILDLLAKPRFVPMMAVKAKIRSAFASEGVSEWG
jgi:hypothetical protein